MQLLVKDSSPLGWPGFANAQVSLSNLNGAGAYSLQFAAGAAYPNPVLFSGGSERFGFGTGDFTIEGYVYPTDSTTANNGLLMRWQGSASWAVEFVGSVMRLNDSGNIRATGATALTINALHHWALTRTGTSVRLWLDGVQQGSTWTNSTNWTSSDIRWGGDNVRANIIGYHSELRVTHGVGRHTTGFTPSYAAWPTTLGGDADWANVVLLAKGDEGSVSTKTLLDIGPLSFAQYAPTWPVSHALADATAVMIRRVDYGGFGQIAGTVKTASTPSNVPVYRRVRLFRDIDAVCIGETWSDPVTGNYAFTGMDPLARYSVVSYDHTGLFRAVIADNLLPTAWAP